MKESGIAVSALLFMAPSLSIGARSSASGDVDVSCAGKFQWNVMPTCSSESLWSTWNGSTISGFPMYQHFPKNPEKRDEGCMVSSENGFIVSSISYENGRSLISIASSFSLMSTTVESDMMKADS